MVISIQETCENIDWNRVNDLFIAVNFGDRGADNIRTVFTESAYVSFAVDSQYEIVGFGRMISDKLYYGAIYDVIVHPDLQNSGIGSQIIENLKQQSNHLWYVTLFAAPGKMKFYEKQGFHKMSTAMMIPRNESMKRDYCESSHDAPNSAHGESVGNSQ